MTEATLKPGWTRVKFGDVVRQVKDKVDPETSGLERYIAGEHMNTDDLRIRGWGEIGDDYLGPAFNMRFKPEQVLYGSRRTYLRKVAIPHFEGICANTTFIIEPIDSKVLLPNLLPFIMQTESFHNHSIKQSKGSVNPYINFSDLVWWEFNLPPADIQTRIVELLLAFEELSEDLLKGNFKANICRRSYLEGLFREKSRKTQPIDKIAKIMSGGTPSKSRKEYWSGSIPWLSSKDMKSPILADTSDHITQAGLEAGSKLAPEGTIFVTVRGMILAHTFPICRNQVPMAFNQDIKAIVPRSGYSSEYIHAWFDWAAPRYLQLTSESSHGTKRLETSQLLRLKVPDLSVEEQMEVLKPIQSIDNSLIKIENKLTELRAIKKVFLSKVIGGVI